MRPLLLIAAVVLSLGACKAAREDNLPEPWRPRDGPKTQAPTCTDGIQNQGEAGVDCGGSCPACIECAANKDCASGRCINGQCLPPTCTDGITNADETDVDCGGSCPGQCANGAECLIDSDCSSFSCIKGLCEPATCGDGRRNGEETGLDCGGSCSPCTPSTRRFGVNIDLDMPRSNPSSTELLDAGAGFIRFVYRDSLSSTEEAAVADPTTLSASELSKVRQALDDARAAGIETLVVLNNETWSGAFTSHENDAAWWSSYRAHFAKRAGAIAKALGDRVTAYEIWNEPDHRNKPFDPNDPDDQLQFRPGIPAARFGELLRDVTPAIRRYSHAIIVSGGTGTGNPTYLSNAATATGGTLHADAIGVHPYGKRPDPDYPDPTWLFGNLEDEIVAFAALGKPIWITEVGVEYSALDGHNSAEQRASQGEFLRRTFQRSVDLESMVERVAWYAWSDVMKREFGLLDDQGNVTATYIAFQHSTTPAPQTPVLETACFYDDVLPDQTPVIRAEFTVNVPEVVWTQPSGTNDAACSTYGAGLGSSAYDLFPSQRGVWRVAAESSGFNAFSSTGQEFPWRFALKAAYCAAANETLLADTGRYTVVGYITLEPGDETDPALFTGGLVREGYEWVQRGVGCP